MENKNNKEPVRKCPIWKDIKGYEGLYQISDTGVVKSLERKIFGKHPWNTGILRKEKILKCTIDNVGYHAANLCKDTIQKRIRVHRLVAECFISNIENKPQVNHKDGNKLNNNIENLEWCTDRENKNHAVKNFLHECGELHHNSKLKTEWIDDIRFLLNKNISTRKIALIYKCEHTTIGNIGLGKSWKSV